MAGLTQDQINALYGPSQTAAVNTPVTSYDGYSSPNNSSVSIGGTTFTPQYQQVASGGYDGNTSTQFMGYSTPLGNNTYAGYDTTGKFTGNFSNPTGWGDFLTALAVAAPVAAEFAGFGAAASGGGGGADVLGAGGSADWTTLPQFTAPAADGAAGANSLWTTLKDVGTIAGGAGAVLGLVQGNSANGALASAINNQTSVAQQGQASQTAAQNGAQTSANQALQDQIAALNNMIGSLNTANQNQQTTANNQLQATQQQLSQAQAYYAAQLALQQKGLDNQATQAAAALQQAQMAQAQQAQALQAQLTQAQKLYDMQSQQVNRANQLQPDSMAMTAANQQQGKTGQSGTMLTGPGGVNLDQLLLGKTTLLGS